MRKTCDSAGLTPLWIPIDVVPPVLGFQGGTANFNPDGYSVFVDDTYVHATGLGSEGVNQVSLNAANIISHYRNLDLGIAAVTAHEVFHHAIGGSYGHGTQTGFIDSNEAQSGGILSKAAAKELIDELDLD